MAILKKNIAFHYLKPETDPQDEGCYAGDEATKECIEGKCSYQAAVHKLNINLQVKGKKIKASY